MRIRDKPRKDSVDGNYNLNLRYVRANAHLTLKQLGQMIGLHHTTICHYETLRNFPDYETAGKIAYALKVDSSKIFPAYFREITRTLSEERRETRREGKKSSTHNLLYKILTPLLDNPENIFIYEELRDSIEKVLITLDKRERKIIEMRYGLEDGRKYTLNDIGKFFGVGVERARQIEARAMRKLQHPSRAKYLTDFFYNF